MQLRLSRNHNVNKIWINKKTLALTRSQSWESVVYIALTGNSKDKEFPLSLRRANELHRGAPLPAPSFRYAKRGGTHTGTPRARFTLTHTHNNSAANNASFFPPSDVGSNQSCLLRSLSECSLPFCTAVRSLSCSVFLSLSSPRSLRHFLRPSNGRDGRGNPALRSGKPHTLAPASPRNARNPVGDVASES